MDLILGTNCYWKSTSRKPRYKTIELYKSDKRTKNFFQQNFHPNAFLFRFFFFNQPFLITKRNLDFLIAKKCIDDLPSLKDISPLKESYFNKIDLKFISDFVKDSLTESLKEVLYSIILLSRTTDLVSLAASNAITFLNKPDFLFTDRDLSRISIPNADLSYGMLINTNFESSNLSGVNFSKSHIYDSNFRNCNMADTNFGEQAPIAELARAPDNLAFSPCWKFFATTDYEKIFLYSLETYQEIGSLIEHEEYVKYLLFSDNGNYLVSASSDSKIILWDTFTKLKLASFTGCRSTANFSPCNTYICLMQPGWNGKSFIYNINTGQIALEICNSIDIPQFSFFSCKSLITLYKNGTLVKWDLLKNQMENSIKSSCRYSAYYSASFCRKYLAINNIETSIFIYNVEKFELIQAIYIMSFNYFVFSNCGRYLTVKLRNNNIIVYDRKAQSKIFEICNKNDVMALAFAQLNYLVLGRTDGTLRAWKIDFDLDLNKKAVAKYGITAASFCLIASILLFQLKKDGFLYFF
ncbi:unnamed protein product [Blepharisma stoltei]|uniref:Uncharacterized protein n=1 Tax=Blepharisma stoltei TaxID=1481888 RepID=A0AAU9INU3_9CILI|nr:unnamed protein product [Blepharisma stoltei]